MRLAEKGWLLSPRPLEHYCERFSARAFPRIPYKNSDCLLWRTKHHQLRSHAPRRCWTWARVCIGSRIQQRMQARR